MLYLVKLDNSYKIGYSKNIEDRLKDLFVTHIDCKLISTKFGNKKDEKELHRLCEKYHIKNELFQIDSEVEEIFNTYISKNLENELNKKLNDCSKVINEKVTIIRSLCNIYKYSYLKIEEIELDNDMKKVLQEMDILINNIIL